MSKRRKRPAQSKKPKQPRPSPAGFQRPTGQAAGAPIQAARPPVTGLMSYMVEPVFSSDRPQPPLGTLAPRGSPGRYRVTYPLAVPGRYVVQDRIDFAELIKSGDSLLEVGPQVHTLQVSIVDPADTATTHTAIVSTNKDHRLRAIELLLHANNFEDAESTAHDIIAPLLSRWSFLHDVAITTSGVQIIEEATQVHRWRLTMIGMVKGFSDIDGASTPEHRVVLSAYRDGISSTEPMWQALSLYKVAEGVWALRNARRAAAVAAGQTPSEPNERVPTDLSTVGHPNERHGLQAALEPFAGKKFRVVFDEIRESVRHAVAHLDPDVNPLIQDRWHDVQRVQQTLPGLRWMARQLLDAELQEHT